MADGGLAAHLRPVACPSCSGRASSTPTGSSGRSAGARAAERDLAMRCRPASRVALDGYAAGVNAWLDAQPRLARASRSS